MRGREVEKGGCALREAIGKESVGVHRHADNFGAGRLEGHRRACRAGVLNGRGRAAMQEKARREADPFLDARRDENARWIRRETTGDRETRGDRRA